MLRLIKCEFRKLKRRKFLPLTIVAAALFPIPMTLLARKNGLEFDWLYLNIAVFGYFLLLPTVLGIIGAMLFFSEKNNGTAKNLRTVPVSDRSMIIAKVIVLLIFSIIYSIATNAATLTGGLIIGDVSNISYRLFIGVVLSSMITVAVLPIITIEALSRRGYIFAVILSFIYSSVSFAVVFAMSNVLTPLSAVFRWALPNISTGPTYGLDSWFLSSPACFGILLLTAIVSLVLAIILKGRQEV